MPEWIDTDPAQTFGGIVPQNPGNISMRGFVQTNRQQHRNTPMRQAADDIGHIEIHLCDQLAVHDQMQGLFEPLRGIFIHRIRQSSGDGLHFIEFTAAMQHHIASSL